MSETPTGWSAPQQPAPQIVYVQQAKSGLSTGQIVAGVGGIGLVVGAFLPWISLQTIFGTIEKNGWDGDGKITLTCGVIVAALVFMDEKWAQVVAVVAGAVAVLVCGLDYLDVSDRVSEANQTDGIAGSVGVGLYLSLAGALAATAGAAIRLGDK